MRRVVVALLAILAIAVVAPEAAGQCDMTIGADGGAFQLCAVGGTAWQWSGPGGFSATTSCVNVTVPGTYTLRVWDGINGLWSAPCGFTFESAPPGAPCSITGADSVCAGVTASWCAPPGEFTYSWSGPDGFSATTACVDVSAAGTYALVVTDLVSGDTSDSCSKTLSLASCAAPHATPSCPAPARWWSMECGSRGTTLDSTTIAAIATGVDERSALWTFAGSADGFCALLQSSHKHSARSGAWRQYAAVLANLCAGQRGTTMPDGHSLGLAPSMSLEGVRGVPAGSTLGDWVAGTENELMSLASASSWDHQARAAFRRIQRQGREINRGSHSGGCGGGMYAMLDDAEPDDVDWTEGTESPSALIAVGTTGGDPLSGNSRMRWSQSRSGEVELAVMDITGRRVRHLVSGVFAAGTHDFVWDGRDDDGRAVRSGAYFVAGRVDETRLSQRLLIVR